uniref:Shisa N-terminal domain-containing protein n=1 Tax=Anguilla anguilla TaxID=7936 RepID=A0A0E9VF62_ANGAN
MSMENSFKKMMYCCGENSQTYCCSDLSFTK